MDPLEEQAQEIEVLESIYPDELEKISNTEFIIHLKLETTPVQYVDLRVEYPPEYPEITPILEVEVGEKWTGGGQADEDDEEEEDYDDEEDEEEDESAAHFEYPPALLELTNNDMIDLKLKAETVAEENMGMPSVFTVVSQLKEDAEEVVQAKMHKVDEDRDKERLEQEAEERKKFEGTEVTKESFAKWRASFRKEMNIDALLNKYIVLDKNGQPKLTGRQMFERGLIDGNEEDDGEMEGGEDLAENIKKLSV
ncbi:uncharacterized protein SAPINGB_P001468 [Magnusiomyces paraingens]|uniref:RWD domain-containing protein n=1 Tax=Magnusiomyces paraingens TaxID=2606893 RepID=A0A5E8B6F3_9ASCO|nr:uncharacterized protein SAPINGB_P001468 [Saprochaete ingens]VVT46950.1 unnamed protein product [Saprochaete ingens]